MENDEEILKKIYSGNPETVTEAINDIKTNGDLNIAKLLLNQLGQIQEAGIMTTVVNLLADIKDNQFKDLLIQKLKTTDEETIKKELLRIVWESSLDYSSYLDYFLEIMKNDPFTIAFEASTVIENLVCNLTTDQRIKLNQELDHFREDQTFLVENIRTELNDQE